MRPSRLHLAAFLGHRLPSQTHTSLFCALCPHSCAPGKNFLVAPLGRTSLSVTHRSRPSTLNLGVLKRWASGKKVTTYWYAYPINPIKPWARVLHPHPLRRPTSSSVNPRPGTSPLGHVRVSSASACAMLCDHAGSTPCLGNYDTRARETTRVGSDTIL